MFVHCLQPRFSETDGLGHISNTALPAWFQEARRELIEIFNPGLAIRRWNLILKQFEIEIHRQIDFRHPVEVRTEVERIGRTSLRLLQEAAQRGTPVATGRTVLVHFDYGAGRPEPIPDPVRRSLAPHVVPQG